MDRDQLIQLFERVRTGEITTAQAVAHATVPEYEDLGFAKLDHDRLARCGMPEVIFGEGKSAEQIAEIFVRLRDSGVNVLATRLNPEAVCEYCCARSHGACA